MKSIGLLFLGLAVAVPLFAAPVMAQSATGADAAPGGHITKEVVYNRLITNLMCLCGCKTTLKTCPHIHCDFAIPRKREILKMLDDGADYDMVVASMVKRFGEQILPAPTKEGFNLVGYILPFVAIFAVGALLLRLAAQWARRGKETAPVDGRPNENLEADADLRRKMEQELSDFD